MKETVMEEKKGGAKMEGEVIKEESEAMRRK